MTASGRWLALLLAIPVGRATGAEARHPAAAPAPARPSRPAPGVLRWPLDLPPAVVSSFGEYRYDHMHAGLDLSTGGGTGHPVRAAADGSVYRLKVEWRGYGRALYLRHADGRSSVYGHLERFEDDRLGLEKRVALRQQQAGTRYPGDIYLDPPVAVRCGQVIAWSGESGVGLPHLHFEMRGPGDEPIDPFRAGLPIPGDRQPPILESIIVTAAEPGTWIDGVLREKIFPLRRRGGVSEAEGPLRVSGAFRADLSGWVPAGGGRSGLRFLETRVDGEVCYTLDFDRFRFDQYPIGGLVFDHRFSHLGPTRMAWRLARLPGNALATGACEAGVGSAVPPGAYLLPEGVHRLEILARDSSGAESRARLCVLSGRPDVPAGGRLSAPADPPGAVVLFDAPAGDSGGEPQAADGDGCARGAGWTEAGLWNGRGFAPLDCRARPGVCSSPERPVPTGSRLARLRRWVAGVPGPWRLLRDREAAPDLGATVSLAPLADFLDLTIDGSAPGLVPAGLADCAAMALDWRPLDGARVGAGWAYADAAASRDSHSPAAVTCPVAAALAAVTVRWASPAVATRVDGDGFRVELPAGSRFYPGPLVVRTMPIAALPEGLQAVGDAVDLQPSGEALDARARLSFSLQDPAAAGSLGIYRWDPESGRYGFEGDEVDGASGDMVLPFRRYGRFALIRDASPPVVRSVRPAQGARLATRRLDMEAVVAEEGKGLGADGVSFTLDGKPIQSEFDPDHGTARPFERPAVGPGRHHLEARATDRAGNSSPPVAVDFEVR